MSGNKNIVVILIVGLLIGAGVGCGVGIMVFQLEITMLETRLSKLESEIATIKNACVQLEKDAVFLNQLNNVVGGDLPISIEIELWDEVRAVSVDVDESLPLRIDVIKGTLIALIQADNPAQVVFFLNKFNLDYYGFETIYVTAIQNHIEAVTGLVYS